MIFTCMNYIDNWSQRSFWISMSNLCMVSAALIYDRGIKCVSQNNDIWFNLWLYKDLCALSRKKWPLIIIGDCFLYLPQMHTCHNMVENNFLNRIQYHIHVVTMYTQKYICLNLYLSLCKCLISIHLSLPYMEMICYIKNLHILCFGLKYTERTFSMALVLRILILFTMHSCQK